MCWEIQLLSLCLGLPSVHLTAVTGSWMWDKAKKSNLGVCWESVPWQREIHLSTDFKFETRTFFSTSTEPWTALWGNTQLHWVGIFLGVDCRKFPFVKLVMELISLHVPKFQFLVHCTQSFSPSNPRNGSKLPEYLPIVLWWISSFHSFFITRQRPIAKHFDGKYVCAQSYGLFYSVHTLDKSLVKHGAFVIHEKLC